MKKTILAIALLLAAASAAVAQTVFVVRHAERADAARTEPRSGAAPRQEMMASDPELSAAGRARAEALASTLRDAGITTIVATEVKRTQQTAAPLATRLGIPVKTIPSKDTAALVREVTATKGNVLIVAHSNTLPAIVKALGIDAPVTIGENDYDDLFVITTGSQPRLLRLHYGQ